jgi:S-DNA-T family DNA segregation ATPase FtsK/SpoIIIE
VSPLLKKGLEDTNSGIDLPSMKIDLPFVEQKEHPQINETKVLPTDSGQFEVTSNDQPSFNVPAILEEALTLDKQDTEVMVAGQKEEELLQSMKEVEVLESTEEVEKDDVQEFTEEVEEEKILESMEEEVEEEEALKQPDEKIEDNLFENKEEVIEKEKFHSVVEVIQEAAAHTETIEKDNEKEQKGHSQSLEQKNDVKAMSQPTTEPKKSSKSSIPFNVMMLPQDRTKKKQSHAAPLKVSSTYLFPGIQLLNYPALQKKDETEWLDEQGAILEETLQSFHVDAKVVHVTKGPSVTRFEVQPGRGVKVTKITGLTDDMKLALAAKDIRIEAPIPGKNTIGIEVPNRESTPVFLREILRRDTFVRSTSPLTVALGLDISGQPIVTDLQKMPHGLVAGATGSGKSVCINSVLISLLFKASPDVVKLMLIDPKMVELAPYNGLPHLVTPVITDAKQATAALKWVVLEMERRYELFSQKGVRDVGRYNEIYSESPDKPELPYILVVIDELADLMMVSPQEVEDSICRIAQKARACGIHLLLATQRPSVDVITGLIKANIPTRIAFSVSSQTDSRTILDMGGAERLLGKGDMLFHENGTPKPVRVQGTFVSDEEIEDVVAHVKKQREPEYLLETEQLKHVAHEEADDEHFEEACYYVIEQGSASASSLQRKFRVGYNRAARLIDMMQERGIVSQAMGSKPRHVLVDEVSLEEILYYKEG